VTAIDRIRNVAIVGSVGAGKTTLAEALLYRAKVIERVGSVEAGTTVTDFEPEEQEAHQSQSLALASFEWRDHKINLLDVPGLPDFEGELHAALRATDFLVVVIDASSGVDHQAMRIWRLAAKEGLPRMVFVNKLDKEHTSFDSVLGQLRERFGAGVAPLELPIGAGEGFHGIADLLTDEAWIYDSGHSEIEPLPDDMIDREHEVHDALVEGIVVGDDEMLERYLEGEIPSLEELEAVMSSGVAAGQVFPVVCGSAAVPIAVDRLADFLCEIGPSPLSRPPLSVDIGDSAVEVLPDANEDTLIYVFKTVADPYVGQISQFRVVTGTLTKDQHLTNTRHRGDERIRSLLTMVGADHQEVKELVAGDLGATAKLSDTHTGDTLTATGGSVRVAPPEWPESMLTMAIVPHTAKDEEKMGTALHRLCDEDHTLRLSHNDETHQTILSGLGETHLRAAIKKMDRKFGVEVDTETPLIAYRQTLTRAVDAEGKYKKQSGGHGQFGVASVKVEPLPRGTGFEFVNSITGGVIPKQYISAVETGIREAMEHGGEAGYPFVDIRATVFDGKTHSVDSSEMSFKMAGRLAFNVAAETVGTVTLEPVSLVEITVPMECQGDIMGDVASRRGHVRGSDPGDPGEQHIVALIPEAELVRYSIDLRAMSGGRGRFTAQHDSYEVITSS
jgi:elongation factor G